MILPSCVFSSSRPFPHVKKLQQHVDQDEHGWGCRGKKDMNYVGPRFGPTDGKRNASSQEADWTVTSTEKNEPPRAVTTRDSVGEMMAKEGNAQQSRGKKDEGPPPVAPQLM
eukprot:TRINITY_DN85925_c0_g1_i1.p2 TRINITY_DN85925_c0_g1~~TRINITY_DN85925_c0_g1_i1.p2  ORF type:complete len:112 (-),score=18.45 TRINITY_DN85925_c0_g1_i1:47-382(-)